MWSPSKQSKNSQIRCNLDASVPRWFAQFWNPNAPHLKLLQLEKFWKLGALTAIKITQPISESSVTSAFFTGFFVASFFGSTAVLFWCASFVVDSSDFSVWTILTGPFDEVAIGLFGTMRSLLFILSVTV